MGVADAIDWVLLARYLNHTCTAEERREVVAWAGRDPANAALLEQARQVWEATGELPGTWDVAGGWERVVARLDAVDAGRVREPARRELAGPARRPRRSRQLLTLSRAAVGVGLIAAAAVIVVVARLTSGSGSSRQPLAMAGREYATAPGERETVTLPDGTEFTLAPGSRLRLAPGYGATRRDLTLEGQAYFAVMHDATRPFVVHTASAVTEDVGTRFVVRAYATDPAADIAVAEGAVAVSGAGAAPAGRAVLTRGMVGRVGGDGTTSIVHGADADAYVAWTSGTLVFQGTTLSEVTQELSRWYGIDIRVEDPVIARRPITASFKGEAKDDVLRAVAAAVGATVERRGQAFVIVAGPASSLRARGR
jgi:transmembrane sensor